MKKKTFIMSCFTFLIIFLGIVTVNAAEQVALATTPINLKSGGAATFTSLHATYDDAMATLTIDSITSGRALNEWVSYVYKNGTYQPKFSVTSGFSVNSCKRVNLGKVGAGSNFAVTDFAYDVITNEAWAGWGGSIKVTTS